MIDRLEYLKDKFQLPAEHIAYLYHMRDVLKIQPQIIYDIGSCTLHWYMAARTVWPDSRIICFDAMQSCSELYEKYNIEYHIATLGFDGRLVDFYENTHDPAGNSYYRENKLINPRAELFYSDQHRTKKFTQSLDRVVRQRAFPLPDLIKLDVQGAELDILTSSPQCLTHAKNIIAEVQDREYNLGAPMSNEITEYLRAYNFENLQIRFSGNAIQGDAHYQKL